MSEEITEAAEHAYGLLWADSQTSARASAARMVLLGAIGREGQKRGIQQAIGNTPPTDRPTAVSAIHLVHLGETIEVRAEIEGRWITLISERADGVFSHFIESDGIRNAYLDALRAQLFAA